MKNIKLRHAVSRQFKRYFFIATCLLIIQNTFAQVAYISADSSIYYMDFKSRNYEHVISFPFRLHFGIYADPKGNLYGHALLSDGPYLVRVNMSDTTHTLIPYQRGSISFVNDSLFYSPYLHELRLYNINTMEYSVVDLPESEGYLSEIAYDRKENLLYAIETTLLNGWPAYDSLLTIQNNQVIHRSGLEDLFLIDGLRVDHQSNLYLLRNNDLYQIDKNTGSAIDDPISLSFYFWVPYKGIAFIDPANNPNQLFTTTDQLNLGESPLNRIVTKTIRVANFSDQPWKFNGAESSTTDFGLTFNYDAGATVTDYLEISLALDNSARGSHRNEIIIHWNDTSEYQMPIETEVITFPSAQDNQVIAVIDDGSILSLDEEYQYSSTSQTEIGWTDHGSLDSSGYLHTVQRGKVYLTDWQTGASWEEYANDQIYIHRAYFGDSNVYLWQHEGCHTRRKIFNEKYELLYEFPWRDEGGICAVSAALRPGSQEFYMISYDNGTLLHKLDMGQEEPELEFLSRVPEGLANLHFDGNGNLRATGTWRFHGHIYQYAQDFSSVQHLLHNSYLDRLEIEAISTWSLTKDLSILNSDPIMAQQDQILIYPNPTTSELNIENPHRAIKAVALFNLAGKRIDGQVVDNGDQLTYLFDEGLETGIYLLQVSFKNGRKEVVKVMVNSD